MINDEILIIKYETAFSNPINILNIEKCDKSKLSDIIIQQLIKYGYFIGTNDIIYYAMIDNDNLFHSGLKSRVIKTLRDKIIDSICG